MRGPIILLLSTLLLGCSTAPEKIAINPHQQVVMDPSVLSAGIVAEHPIIGNFGSGKRATVGLNNDRSHPVTLHYRFYWYDAQGLDVLPAENTRTVTVPANGEVDVVSDNGSFAAQRARLYLFL